jgi:hypothetical protein
MERYLPWRRAIMLSAAQTLALGALLLGALGCGAPLDQEEENEDSGIPGRGSETCQEWQDALCDWAADQCDGLSRAACDRQAKAVRCSSDSAARECITTLSQSSCDEPETECGVLAMADREPAEEACEEYARVVCASDERCGAGVASVCTPALIEQLGCSSAYGVALEYETCIQQLELRECNDALPAICDTVLLVE